MHDTYSALAAPPCRGFILNGYTRKNGSKGYCVDVQRHPILGVVTRSSQDEQSESPDLLPVYLDDQERFDDFDWSGGLQVFSPGDQNHIGFRVVWCMWPEEEDEVRAMGERLLDQWSNGDPETRRRCANGFGDIISE